MSALLPSSSFQPVTSRHQLGLATGGVSVGDGLSPTEMERRQPVTDRNRLVTNCNQLTFEIEPIRVYPQIAEPDPPGMRGICFCFRDNWLDVLAQGFRLCQGRLNAFVRNQCDGKISQQGPTVLHRTAEMVSFFTVSHF